MLLSVFFLLQSSIPLRTAVQIGADEGFELAKAMLCLKGFKLYSDVWDDQPPLHTFIITEVLRNITPSVVGPRLVTVVFAALVLASVFVMALRLGGLLSATLTTLLLMASPGFIELSSSCMMEIPALSPAVAAICVLLVGRKRKWHLREIACGLLFGIGLAMKLLGLILLPLAVLVIWLRYRPTETPLTPPLSPSDGERGGVRGFRGMIRLVLPHGMIRTLIIVCVSTALTFVALDVLIDRGDFLRHFQQSWVSHFTPAVSFDYGSPIDHRFPPSLLLKNWDMTIPAALGIVLLLRQVRKVPLAIVPVAWLALVLTVFATHTPWWPYYYVHIAIPLCWCAGSGIAIMLAASPQNIGVVLGRDREVNSRRRFGALAVLAVFLVCALSWMVLRVYLQISGIRNSPQTYYSLVLKEIQRFKPFTQWIYADNLTYSFHAGIPMPPQLAVVSLKRLWSGELTIAGVGDEVRKFKPGLIVLRNDTRELPFQDLLDTEYRLVYRDAENRLYAHRTIANKPDL